MHAIALLLALLVSSNRPVSGPPCRVGVVRLTIIDPAHADTMPTLIWYPTTGSLRTTTMMLQTVDVAPAGRYSGHGMRRPLIIISHGTGGNEMGHSDLAMALVRGGYIVVTFRHAGDNNFDHSGLGTDRQIFGRAQQVRSELDSVLADPTWRQRIDPSRIGFFGFSAGGYTGLLLGGAEPDTARLSMYCRAVPTDPNYCAGGMHGKVDLTGRYAANQYDSRIKAAALAAPALTFMFDSAQLHRVSIPLLIARAERDSVVREPYDVTWLLRTLPSRPKVLVLPAAGHFTFLAPCGPKLAAAVPDICTDAPGISRTALHAKLDAAIVHFFDRHLEVEAGR